MRQVAAGNVELHRLRPRREEQAVVGRAVAIRECKLTARRVDRGDCRIKAKRDALALVELWRS